MRFLLSIMLIAVIFDGLAAPVNQANESTSTSLQTILTDIATLQSVIKNWQNINGKIKYESPFFENTILPTMKKALELMDNRLEFPHSDEATRVMEGLDLLKFLLGLQHSCPSSIVHFSPSFDNEKWVLNCLKLQSEYQKFEIKKRYYEFYHYPDSEGLLVFMGRGSDYIQKKEEAERISSLYETKMSAEETMSQSFEKLRKNFYSFDQIDQFITMYEFYLEFFKNMKTPIYRAEREFITKMDDYSALGTTSDSASSSKHAGSSMLDTIYDLSVAEPEPRSTPQKEGNDLPHIVPDTTPFDPAPSSKRRGLNNSLFQVLDNFNSESDPLLFSFSTLIHKPAIAIMEKLEGWKEIVKTNQPIDTSEVLSALKGCIEIMRKIEPYISYFPLCKNDYQFHKLALQTVDGFRDLLKHAALTNLEYESRAKISKPGTHLFVNPILPTAFFGHPIFIESCIAYSHLLLQNNCRKLRMKPASLLKPNDFVEQSRPYVNLIKTYQPLLELQSFDQNVIEGEEGILGNSEKRALSILKKNLDSLFKSPPCTIEVLEQFFVDNKNFVTVIQLADLDWMKFHVNELLDIQPTDVHQSSSGKYYIDFDFGDGRSGSRRLYTHSCV